METSDAISLLTHQAALASEYALIVAVIALAVFCISVLYKARVAKQLRQTGAKHDTLQMRYFNPAQQMVVQRPAESFNDASNEPPRRPHRSRAQR